MNKKSHVSLMCQHTTNWYQLKDSFLLKIKGNLLKELINKAIYKAGNINQLCNKISMSTPSFYNLKKGKVNMISVKKIKAILNFLNINYDYINDKITYTKKGYKVSINNPIFPINLNCKEGATLLGMIVSDGCIYIDKKARGVKRTKYSTSERESIEEFEQCIKQIYGDVLITKEFVRNCEILRIGSSIVGDSLIKAGAILGHKASMNGNIPWLIKEGSKEMKTHYLKAAFSDEGSIYSDNKNAYRSYIILTRYFHIKPKKEELKELKKIERYMNEITFPTGHVNKSISIKKAIKLSKKLSSILNEYSNLLKDESKILNDLGIETRLWNRTINKTSKGRYSVSTDLFINKNKSLVKFYKEIGFSLKSKQEKLKKVVNKIKQNGIKNI